MHEPTSAGTRAAACGALGLAVGIAVGALMRQWAYATSAGWISGAAAFVTWVWWDVGRRDATQTRRHATREDATRATSDLLVLLAAVASVAGVGGVLVAASSGGGAQDLLALLGVLAVALAWLVVHTRYTLRYARLYYTDPVGGVDFNQDEEPRYSDFAYLAFTIGMTYQVSDTDFTQHPIRATALRHALLSFLLGSLVLATTINLVASTLGGSGGGG